MNISRPLFLLFMMIVPVAAQAQEYIAPLQVNKDLVSRPGENGNIAQKPTALTLPFFEDFTDYDVYPSSERWAEQLVYVNNTMAVNPVSRGVATFDALDKKGVPYDSVIAYHQVYADSLTILPIALSGFAPADSVYLSFFYQPKGKGFSPKPYDSLMLYMLKSNGVWDKVWSVSGDTLQPFRQVMIPVTDTGYFNDNFQVRWVNKATKGISDSHWNLDYIRIAAGRGIYDTLVRDIAFTKEPVSILNDFTAMPFRHFKTNPAAFLATNTNATLKNNGTALPNIPAGYYAKAVSTGATIGTGNTNIVLPQNIETEVSFPMYNAGGFNPADPNGKVVFENTYYCTGNYPGESQTNDTIVHQQVFDNYFAYDDGTAEQSYFLNLYPSAPGYTAIEYALYMPDTIRGVAIRFARQTPSAWQKEFSLAIYRSIAINGGTDQLQYKEDFLYPKYEDTVNKFSVYVFEQPQVMNAGVFYVSVIQPAGGTSDSLYIAMDANRTGNNHRYVKLTNLWQPSLLEGALMIRPIVGNALPTGIKESQKEAFNWSMSPNPANDHIRIEATSSGKDNFNYTVCDIQGKVLLQGITRNGADINVSTLRPGIYFIRLGNKSGYSKPLKLVKL